MSASTKSICITSIALLSLAFLGSLPAPGGTFTNTGSASISCIWGGLGAPVPPDLAGVEATATGSTIDLTCPAAAHPDLGNYIGPTIIGSASNLATKGTIFFGPTGFTGPIAFSFQSSFTDSLVPLDGTGIGTVEFTLTYTWTGFGDLGGGTTEGDFLFNGTPVWHKSDEVCQVPPPLPACAGPFTSVIVIDEPVTYGMAFSYEGDDLSSAAGRSVGTANSLVISPAILTGGQLAELPEPSSLWLSSIGLVGLTIRLLVSSRRPGQSERSASP